MEEPKERFVKNWYRTIDPVNSVDETKIGVH